MQREATNLSATGYWKVVGLLLGASRRRAAGRKKRQQELMSRRKGGSGGLNLGALAFVGTVALMFLLHGWAAFFVNGAAKAGRRLTVEKGGRVVVWNWSKNQLREFYQANPTPKARRSKQGQLDDIFNEAARDLSRESGRSKEVEETRLRAAVTRYGVEGWVSDRVSDAGLEALPGSHSPSALLGSLALFWWALMLVFQGEGLELDLQRRRHPMWEWLYAHPVSAAAIFTAEMLAPVAANPMYAAAPAFVGVLYGLTYDPVIGLLAALVAGVPVALAAACLGKALEIGATIRFSPRSRGALLGLMSWAGYASMMLLILMAVTRDKVLAVAGHYLEPLTALPWPWLGWFVGRHGDGSFSFLLGFGVCWLVSAAVGGLAVAVCLWGVDRGLSGSYGEKASLQPKASDGKSRFGREPLYRKEFLWFIRDRSAVVQTILIPMTVASFQLFNLRGAIAAAQGAWNYLSGAAVLFGTYFLWVLGPKSLASEGSALWLALTWPRGLENLLKAKAWLWALISTGLVALVLAYAVFLFPAEWWKIVLLSVGWWVFARSMADKTVTLVSVTSSSGEPEPIPKGRRWAASLGMLTFAIGVLTQQWTLAVTGIVYSHLTAAAMWENFRARLPYLYDPWSEKLPSPPTLMHAMVAISLLVEGAALVSAPVLLFLGKDYFEVGRTIAYDLSALAVAYGTAMFLEGRNVANRTVWCWQGMRAVAGKTWEVWCGDGSYGGRFWRALALGAGGGLALGGLARVYLWALMWSPTLGEMIRRSQEQMANSPGLKWAYVIAAVGVAPFAEEYLFRGLLFRALDREWGGWKAVVGSAAFFAIYHPPLSWAMVALVGGVNALLFKRTGRLAPAVALHMAYNAVVAW